MRRRDARPATPNLRVVRVPRRRARIPFYVVSSLLLAGLVVGLVSVQALVSQGSFRVQELSRRMSELQASHGALKLEVAELSSPSRIAAEAKRLGFRQPAPEDVQVLYLGPLGPPAGHAKGDRR